MALGQSFFRAGERVKSLGELSKSLRNLGFMMDRGSQEP